MFDYKNERMQTLLAVMNNPIGSDVKFLSEKQLLEQLSHAYLCGEEVGKRNKVRSPNPICDMLFVEYERRHPLPEGCWYGMKVKGGKYPAKDGEMWVPWPLGKNLLVPTWLKWATAFTDKLGYRVIDLKDCSSKFWPPFICFIFGGHKWLPWVQSAGSCNNPFVDKRYVHCDYCCGACAVRNADAQVI